MPVWPTPSKQWKKYSAGSDSRSELADQYPPRGRFNREDAVGEPQLLEKIGVTVRTGAARADGECWRPDGFA
jgi:hypothetical protein